MKYYKSCFGCFGIVVPANTPEEAKTKMIQKFNGYKDGSTKKEAIRPYMQKDFNVWPVHFKNGFWREA